MSLRYTDNCIIKWDFKTFHHKEHKISIIYITVLSRKTDQRVTSSENAVLNGCLQEAF